RTSPTTRSSSRRCALSQSESTTRGKSMRRTYLQRGDDLRLGGDRRPLEQPLEPIGKRREAVELDTEHVACAQDPRHVCDVGEAELASRQPRLPCEQVLELRELAVERRCRAFLFAPERVVRLREVVVAEDPQTRKRAIARIGWEQRRLRVPLLEVLEDH